MIGRLLRNDDVLRLIVLVALVDYLWSADQRRHL